MNIVIFIHPSFLGSMSMPLFALTLSDGLKKNGHVVDVWTANPFFYKLPGSAGLKKWLGYIDQFLIFPFQVRLRLRSVGKDTLFVFADQALGPWVPLVADREHVIHCHDFLALRSSLGEIPQNPISWTGKIYQRFIRNGFSKGRNFISVSSRTRDDLHRFLGDIHPERSSVVLNGMNHPYKPIPLDLAKKILLTWSVDFAPQGFILNVGGNQWYKNRDGVLSIYSAYAQSTSNPLPLVMVGAAPSARQRYAAEKIANGRVVFVVRPPIEVLEAAYSAAAVMLFPSHAEGFGWPIIEAMACGCPVLTTNDAPMTEVGGSVAYYLPKMDLGDSELWAKTCAERLTFVLSRDDIERIATKNAGIEYVRKFDADKTMKSYFSIYNDILGC